MQNKIGRALPILQPQEICTTNYFWNLLELYLRSPKVIAIEFLTLAHRSPRGFVAQGCATALIICNLLLCTYPLSGILLSCQDHRRWPLQVSKTRSNRHRSTGHLCKLVRCNHGSFAAQSHLKLLLSGSLHSRPWPLQRPISAMSVAFEAS